MPAWVAVFFILEMAVLLILFLRLGRTQNQITTIPYKNITGTTIPDDRNGWYVDNTFPLADDGLFDYTAEQAMKPGVYEITVNYETDTDKNYSTVGATTNSEQGLQVDQVILPAKLTHVTYSAWLYQSAKDFSVKNYYNGTDGYLIIKDITIVRTNQLERMQLFLAFVVFLLLDLVIAGSVRAGSFANFLYKRRMVFLLILSALAVMVPDLDGGITQGDDLCFHLLRIEGLAKSFRDGIIPCKLQTNWAYGYGYAVSLFYGDLFLSIPAVLRIIGFSVQFSYNVFMFLIQLTTVTSAYYCCKKISGSRWISYASALVYLFSPYAMLGVYYRNALGEAEARAFFPLAIYGIFLILTADTASRTFRRSWVYLVAGLTGMIESHNLSCVILAEFTLLVFLFSLKRVFQKKRFLMLLKSGVLTFLLNAWFIVPLVLSYHNLNLTEPYKNELRIQDTGVELRNLFSWTYGRDLSGLTEVAFGDNIYTVGVAVGIVLLLFILLFIRDRSSAGKKVIPGYTMYFWSVSVLALCMATKYFPWNRISDLLGNHATLVSNIEFTERYMTVVVVLSPFLMCFTLMAVKEYYRELTVKIAGTALAGLSFLTVWPQLCTMPTVKIYDMAKFGRTDYIMAEYRYNKYTEYTSADYMAHKIDPQYDFVPGKITAGDSVTYADFSQSGIKASVQVSNSSDQESYVDLPICYYEQYNARDSKGNFLKIEPNDINVMRLIIPAVFNDTISISFDYPASWKISEAISILAIVVLLVTFLMRWRDQHRKALSRQS